jgi:hypothetical protein
MPATFLETVRNKLRYMIGTDLLSDVDEGFQRLAEDVDTKMASFSQDTLAKRPAAGRPNALFYAEDTGVLFRDTGTVWRPVNPELALSTTTAPVGGEYIELAGSNTVALPTPATPNKVIGVANTGVVEGGIKVTTAVGEIWTVGKTLYLNPGESVILRSDGNTWIIAAQRARRAAFSLGAIGGGSIVVGSERTFYLRPNGLVSYRQRWLISWGGGAEGGALARLYRDGVVVAEENYKVAAPGNVCVVPMNMDYVETAGGGHLFQVVVIPYGSSVSVNQNGNGMLIADGNG